METRAAVLDDPSGGGTCSVVSEAKSGMVRRNSSML